MLPKAARYTVLPLAKPALVNVVREMVVVKVKELVLLPLLVEVNSKVPVLGVTTLLLPAKSAYRKVVVGVGLVMVAVSVTTPVVELDRALSAVTEEVATCDMLNEPR